MAVLHACYPEGPEYADELDIVHTNYDPSFDFKSANTNNRIKCHEQKLIYPYYAAGIFICVTTN